MSETTATYNPHSHWSDDELARTHVFNCRRLSDVKRDMAELVSAQSRIDAEILRRAATMTGSACTGCGSTMTDAEILEGRMVNSQLIACCPERDMQPISQTTIPGVNGQVVLAASDMTDEQKRQPEWLWHENDRYATSYGRWQVNPTQAPYIRADIVLAMLRECRKS